MRRSAADSVGGSGVDFALPQGRAKATFARLYREVELYRTLLRTYTKSLFSWRKALVTSYDLRTLYDFARHTPQNADRLHGELANGRFRFREGLRLCYNFNGKQRTIYVFPWEERIVDLLLYRVLSRHFHGVLAPSCYAYRFRSYGVDACQHRVRASLLRLGRPLWGMRRDVADYFPSVDHDILLAGLREWVEPDDYLYELLEQRVRFRYRDGDAVLTASRGIPFGTASACFLSNVYLTPVDRAMGAIAGLRYYRYADDMLAFSDSRDAALDGRRALQEQMALLKLESKEKHHLDFRLDAAQAADADFRPTSRVRYLGIEYDAQGQVRLPRDKFRKLRNQFRFAFRRARRRLARAGDPLGRAAVAVQVARDVVEKSFRPVAIIDYYLKHVTDEEQLRLLDRWLAEEVLAVAFQDGHRKGNWRRLPFKELRRIGLPSLRHRRRLILHGRIESSFFRMRTDRRIESERGRLPGRKAFSPCLEAAAEQNS
jgi:hypothetical protein